MIYTLDDMRNILSNPIDHSKWGSDTHAVIGILNIILSANCSSCMFRRKVRQLNDILSRHGDSIVSSEYSVAGSRITSTSKSHEYGRLPCPDCVVKHLSQAYVLQSEFYQGYTDYLPLIEAHLMEALEECPKDNKTLIRVINDCIRSVSVNKYPSIPIVLMTKLIDSKAAPDHADIVCEEIPEDKLKTALGTADDKYIEVLDLMLTDIDKYIDISDHRNKAEWSGRLAVVSDILSKISPSIAQEVRRRRLKYSSNGQIVGDDKFMLCSDIRCILNDEILRRHTHNENRSDSRVL